MNQKTTRIIGIGLQMPMLLFMIAAFGVTIYAAANNIAGVTYGSSILIGILIGLYAVGRYLIWKQYNDRNKKSN